MTLAESIINFTLTHIDEDNNWYGWDINEDHLPTGLVLLEGNQYRKNVDLKIKLSEVLAQTEDSEIRKNLIEYYVSTWGGIRTNSMETIKRYAFSKPEDLIVLGSKGIASWSKVLCICDPYQYAIFDARVSASLNSLQIIDDIENKVLYPVLISRNKTIKNAIKLIKREANRTDWGKASEAGFYKEYLSYLHKTASSITGHINVEIYTIEMLLFAKAEELVRHAFPNEIFS